MRQYLLLAASALFAVAGQAQTSATLKTDNCSFEKESPVTSLMYSPLKVENAQKLPERPWQQSIRETAKRSNRVISDKVFYRRPSGSLYGGWNVMNGGGGYYVSTLMIPAFTDVVFENVTEGISSWTVNGNDATKDVVDGNYVSNYSRHSTGYGTAMYYAPTVTSGETSYTFGEYNVYVKRKLTTATSGRICTDSIGSLYAADDHAATYSNGTWYGPMSSWGLLDSDNLFGSGKYASGEDTYVSSKAIQVFPKPASPLFITKLHVQGLTSSQPIPEGKQLRALITKVKTVTKTYKDGTTEDVQTADLDNVIDILYANPGDTINFDANHTTTRNKKTLKQGYVIFEKPGEEDAIGNIIPGNIVIGADEPFAVVIDGFEQEGIDLGLYAMEVEEYDDTVVDGEMIFDNGRSLSYTGTLALAVGLVGMFDVAYAPQIPGYYIFEDENIDYRRVSVPVEGTASHSVEDAYGNTTYETTGSALITGKEEDKGFPGVPVFTNITWYNEDESPNYYLETADGSEWPAWITNYTVFTGYKYGMHIVAFEADPLPAGTTGRFAQLKVVGQEANMNGEVKYSAESDNILVIQGEVDLTGIEAVKTNATKVQSTSAIYNLAGQRVDQNFKGLVIKDGKKFFVK